MRADLLRDMGPHLPKTVHFVPAHPVAGTEYSGPDAGFAELFVNRWCILTPPEGTDPEAVKKLADAYNRTRLTPFVQKILSAWLKWQRT